MKQTVRKIITHPLFSGSAIMVFGTNFVSGLNYLYHFLLGRMLGPSSYGELVSLFSLIGLLGMLPVALNLAITKFVSSSDSNSEIHGLLVSLQKRTLWLVGIFVVLSFILAIPAKNFLHLSNASHFTLTGLVFALSLPVFINRAVMQGTLRFFQIVISLFFDNGFKLLGGLLFVSLGYSVFGALFAILITSFFSLVISFYFVRDLLKKQKIVVPNLKPFVVFTFPVFIHQFAITSMNSSDLILVKHFFVPTEAGIYSATSTLAKIIFYAASPVMSVMFPIIAKRFALGQKYHNIFLLSLLLTSAIAIGAAIVFTFFAPLAVWVLFGRSFDTASSYLPLFCLFMILLTVNNLFIGFFLSINKTKLVLLPLAAAIAQIVLINIFHSTLFQVLEVSIIISALLTFCLIVYSIYERKTCFSYSASIQTGENNRKRSRKDL